MMNIKAAAAAVAEPRGASGVVFLFHYDLGCPLVLNLLLLSLFPLSLLNIHLVACICFFSRSAASSCANNEPGGHTAPIGLMVDLTLPSSGHAKGAGAGRHQPTNMVKY